jgi:hypothetical protein
VHVDAAQLIHSTVGDSEKQLVCCYAVCVCMYNELDCCRLRFSSERRVVRRVCCLSTRSTRCLAIEVHRDNPVAKYYETNHIVVGFFCVFSRMECVCS